MPGPSHWMSTALTRSDVLCCAVSCCVALQVRSVTVGEIGIITGSRDTTIKIWGDDAPDTCALLHTLVSRVWGGGWGPVQHQLAARSVLQS
jgi:hypothetical protein